MDALIDAHCHLQFPGLFSDASRHLAEARDAGVSIVVVNSTCEADWATVGRLAAAHSQVKAAFGLHPKFIASKSSEWLDHLQIVLDGASASIGEIGLDFSCDIGAAAQESVFLDQLALARSSNLPVTVHCVKAWGRLVELIKKQQGHEPGLLMHACAAPKSEMRALVKMGARFSFSAAILDERYKSARAALMACPLDRLMIETDSPCAISSGEGKCPSPAFLPNVLVAAAKLRGEEIDRLADITTLNAKRFFRIEEDNSNG